MNENAKFKLWFKNNWLVILIAMQPVLDAVAYWNQNSVATISGYIRLAIMIALPVYLFFTLKKKKSFIAIMAVMGVFSLLHIINGFRVGYLNLFYDVSYLLRVLQAPVLAVCFIYLIRDENKKKQAVKGILWAAGIFVGGILAALITNTWNSTYGAGVGLSGWVIDDNRCANSIITVSLAVFAVGAAAVSKNKLIQILIPVTAAFFMLANGTKACYGGLFAILVGYAVFMLMSRLITKEKLKPVFLLVLAVLTVVSVLIYPYTPRAQIDASQGNAKSAAQIRFEQALEENGYTDVESLSFEEKMADPVLKNIYFEYYVSVIGAMSDIYDRFGMDRVFEKYNMTSDINTIIDSRIIKTTYASLIWDDCDVFTKLVGFESTETIKNDMFDMENDYPAVFYYYGYLGFCLYMLFLCYFIFLIIKRLIKDFKGSFTMENFTLLLCLILQLGLAQFSGALLRRPNVSIYLSLVLALVYYNTKRINADERKEAET